MKKNNSSFFCKFSLAIIFQLFALSIANASGLRLDTESGYDSNPFKLTNNFDPEGSHFLEAKLRYSHDFNSGFNFKLKSLNRNFSSDFSDADSSKNSLELGYKKKFKLFGKASRLSSNVNFGSRDKTFVSRLSGNVGETRGTSTANRYDYTFKEIKTGIDFKLSKNLKLNTYLELHDREYDSFADIGLSNLNYTESSIGTSLRYKIRRSQKFDLGIAFANRDFEDRRGRTPEGSLLTGTNLQYDYFRINSGYQFKINSALSAKISISHEDRTDNVAAYYDLIRQKQKFILKYAHGKYSDFRFDITNSKLDYSERTGSPLPEEENLSNEDGLSFKLGYQYKFQRLKNLRFYTNYKISDVDSNQIEYQYDRQEFEIGFRLSAF